MVPEFYKFIIRVCAPFKHFDVLRAGTHEVVASCTTYEAARAAARLLSRC